MLAAPRLRISRAHTLRSSTSIDADTGHEAGAVAIFETSSLERGVRDIQAAVKHVAMSPYSYIVAGRLRLGLDPGTTRF